MATHDLGMIESKQGNLVHVRWDDETEVVEVHLYHYPLKGDPHWQWIKAGIAKTRGAAFMTATNYLRRE